MPKLTIIGAGSTVFTKNIVVDLLTIDKFESIEISLMDIDVKRLDKTYELLKIIFKKFNLKPRISKFTNRKEALQNADFVQTTIQVGGYKPATIIDFEIPKKYGLQQTIADTLGIGGIMRGLRTIPVLLDIAKDISEVCPTALWMQYVNPMSANMIAINKVYPEIKSIGLCHSVQGTIQMLANDLNESIEDIDYLCAGINHMSFYQKITKKSTGEDLYPKLKILAEKIINDEQMSTRTMKKEYFTDKKLHEKIRYEILKRFGYFVTESSEHFAEYVPWFIKKNRNDLIEKYKIPIGEYLDRCKLYIDMWDKLNIDISPLSNQVFKRSNEYASYILEAVIKNRETTVYGNVINNGLIENLPSNCCVEVPCIVNEKGFQPNKIGALPEHLACLMRTNINVHLLTAEAAITKKKEKIYHAAMLDPLTSSNLSIDEIYKMTDEMIDAHGSYLPNYN
ncbi:MAG: alpha-glucosidase/alpha-galactosidase [Pelagibacteraceae bacterium]|nr:alpha-glucosidase/alpha-galactosidase [Pelagibacteraceae bacterium]|tara:strand:+ start:145 stop:1500 length:1356 start_codon:yes stop_codon:yes gene_type:complete